MDLSLLNMFTNSVFSLLLAIAATTNATLERRYPYAGGGWGLRAGAHNCPAGTFESDAGGGYDHCCPNGMVETDGYSFGCCSPGKARPIWPPRYKC